MNMIEWSNNEHDLVESELNERYEVDGRCMLKECSPSLSSNVIHHVFVNECAISYEFKGQNE